MRTTNQLMTAEEKHRELLRAHDLRVETRISFMHRRRELLESWKLAHEVGSDNEAHWAAKIQLCNDAEILMLGGC